MVIYGFYSVDCGKFIPSIVGKLFVDCGFFSKYYLCSAVHSVMSGYKII